MAEEFRAFADAGFTVMIVRHIMLDKSKILESMVRLAEVRRAMSPEA